MRMTSRRRIMLENISIQTDRGNCTYLCVTLVVLAVIAAAGAATLIAFSGGPTNAQFFYTGVALGVVAVGFTGWAIGLIADSIRHRNEQNKIADKVKNDPVPDKTILEEMEKPEVTREQIEYALRNFPEERDNTSDKR